jgi:hypothetical protein
MSTSKRFTMRDENGHVVAGLENVEEGNALLTGNGRVTYDKPLSSLAVEETAHGEGGAGGMKRERYFVTQTA